MDRGNRATALVVGLIATAAGVAVAAYLWRAQARSRREEPDMRPVADILSDCYARLRGVQESLSHLPGAEA